MEFFMDGIIKLEAEFTKWRANRRSTTAPVPTELLTLVAAACKEVKKSKVARACKISGAMVNQAIKDFSKPIHKNGTTSEFSVVSLHELTAPFSVGLKIALKKPDGSSLEVNGFQGDLTLLIKAFLS
jgi:hypothetical protein